jgi:hypothetical protein
MKKIVFVFIILFIFAFPAFAGENVERQVQEQILVASGDETCKNECDFNKNICKSDCSHNDLQTRSGRELAESCKGNCLKTYDNCMDRCDSSGKEISELQEQCKKNAAALFKKEYGKGYEQIRDGSYMSNYTNHYNVKLNKCFVLVKITYVPNSKKEDALIMKDLSDTNENKQYGSFGRFRRESIPISCSVENRICKSEAEWDSLVKYFMEE